MTMRSAEVQALRKRRKQDLLLASALVRHQAVVSMDQIGQRVDLFVLGYRQVRGWLSVPHMGLASGLAASVATLLALRHIRLFRALRWALVGWRVTKLVAGLTTSRRGLP